MSLTHPFVVSGPENRVFIDKPLGNLLYETLQANKNNSQPISIDLATNRQYSYKQFLGLTCSLAQCMKNIGLGEKSTIFAICSENNGEFFIPVISGLFLGVPICPISHHLTHYELTHCLNITKPSIIFCSKQTCKKLIEIKATEGSFIKKLIVIDSNENLEHDEAQTLTEFIRTNLSELIYSFNLAEIQNTKEQLAFIFYSSGTTGLPKGVMLSHHNLLSKYAEMINNNDLIEKSPNQYTLALLPCYHCFGLVVTLLSIIHQHTGLMMSKFEEIAFLEYISSYNVERLILVPPLLAFLAKHPIVPKYDLSHIVQIFYGGAPINKDVEVKLRKRMPNTIFLQAYGMTETTLGVLTAPRSLHNHNDRFGACGVVTNCASLKICDPQTENICGPNQKGEICVKGPMVMMGYYNNPEATKATFTSDGWLKTGDIGYYDEDKYFYIVDRMKELIKYKGFQVAPAELEMLLLSHPDVEDAGVVGLPTEDVGEVPVAFIKKVYDSNVSAREIQNFVAENVSPQKKLRGGVYFVEQLPKSAAGKLLRKELRKMLENLHA